jgi:hypothetical protein
MMLCLEGRRQSAVERPDEVVLESSYFLPHCDLLIVEARCPFMYRSGQLGAEALS